MRFARAIAFIVFLYAIAMLLMSIFGYLATPEGLR